MPLKFYRLGHFNPFHARAVITTYIFIYMCFNAFGKMLYKILSLDFCFWQSWHISPHTLTIYLHENMFSNVFLQKKTCRNTYRFSLA
jgi:hypothetical protein